MSNFITNIRPKYNYGVEYIYIQIPISYYILFFFVSKRCETGILKYNNYVV